jgi:bacillithiol system protein YtxJ
MNWKPLNHPDQLDEIINSSRHTPQYIFKHSTRCSISVVAKNRLEKEVPGNTIVYYLDLLTYRSLSNEVSNRWHVVHQSPQLLKIENGTCTYHASHLEIEAEVVASY